MTMRAALILIGTLLLLAAGGCAVPDDYGDYRDQGDDAAAALEDWIGLSDHDLVLKLGAPDAVYQMRDESRILTWRRSRTESQGGEIYTVTETRTVDGEKVVIPVTRQAPVTTTRYECVLNIEVDADGYVVGYTAEGNDCIVQPPPG